MLQLEQTDEVGILLNILNKQDWRPSLPMEQESSVQPKHLQSHLGGPLTESQKADNLASLLPLSQVNPLISISVVIPQTQNGRSLHFSNCSKLFNRRQVLKKQGSLLHFLPTKLI